MNRSISKLVLTAAATAATLATTALSISVMAAPTAPPAPDEKSEALLTALAQKVASWGDYRVEFSVTIGGQTLAGSYEVSGTRYRVVTPEIVLYCDGVTRHEVNLLDREVAIDRVDPNDRTVMGNPTRLFDFLDGSYSHSYVGVALIDGVGCERIRLTDSALSASTRASGAVPGAGNGSGSGTGGSGNGFPAVGSGAGNGSGGGTGGAGNGFPAVGSGAGNGAGIEIGSGSGSPQTLDIYLSTATGLPVRVGYTIGLLSTEAAVDVVRITPRIALGADFSYDAARYRGFETVDFR